MKDKNTENVLIYKTLFETFDNVYIYNSTTATLLQRLSQTKTDKTI